MLENNIRISNYLLTRLNSQLLAGCFMILETESFNTLPDILKMLDILAINTKVKKGIIMATVNKVILVGRLGRNPEVRYFTNGESMANFPLATEEHWKDRNGTRQTRSEWHNIVLYGNLVEIANKYLNKGSLVFIEGRIQSKKYKDKNNIERTAYNIIASEMCMLGIKNSTTPQVNQTVPATQSTQIPAPP